MPPLPSFNDWLDEDEDEEEEEDEDDDDWFDFDEIGLDEDETLET